MKQDAKAARTRNPADRLRPVAGRHNPRLKELRLAFRRAEPTAQGECAIEGVKLLEEALRSGRHVESVFFSESARPLAEKLLPQIGARTETLVLPDALFNSIVPSDAPRAWRPCSNCRLSLPLNCSTARATARSLWPRVCKIPATWAPSCAPPKPLAPPEFF